MKNVLNFSHIPFFTYTGIVVQYNFENQINTVENNFTLIKVKDR